MPYVLPKSVSSNPTLVEFPTDTNNVLGHLRKEGLRAAMKCRDQDMIDMTVFTLKLLILHVVAAGAENIKAKQKALADHLAREEAKLAAAEADKLVKPVLKTSEGKTEAQMQAGE